MCISVNVISLKKWKKSAASLRKHFAIPLPAGRLRSLPGNGLAGSRDGRGELVRPQQEGTHLRDMERTHVRRQHPGTRFYVPDPSVARHHSSLVFCLQGAPLALRLRLFLVDNINECQANSARSAFSQAELRNIQIKDSKMKV